MQYEERISSYQDIQVSTSDPGKVILLLYSRLENELANAKDFIEQRNFEDKANAIILSQDIVLELTNSLNFEAGPLATNLQSLYLYVYRELNQINLKNDLESLGKVMEIVKNLHASWQEIIENNPEATVAAKRQQSRLENMTIVG